MFSIRLIPAAALLLLSACVWAREERAPSADELHELSLEELLEIPIETVRSAHEEGPDTGQLLAASADGRRDLGPSRRAA